MPRGKKKMPSSDFLSAFDDQLNEIETPEDSLESDIKGRNISEQEAEQELELESNNEHTPEPISEVSESQPTNSQAQKFGLTAASESDQVESINKTYKLNEYTVRKLDSLIHKDSKNTKKIAGTKGFLSDFLDNAIWQHFYQLGLIDEQEANQHIKDYGKYPINVDNFKNIKK